jgi:thiamine biosynthesis lipoprotein ApbE
MRKNALQKQAAKAACDMIMDAIEKYERTVSASQEILKVNILNSGIWVDSRDAKLSAIKICKEITKGIKLFVVSDRAGREKGHDKRRDQ